MIFILEDNLDRIANFKNALGMIEHHIERVVPAAIEWLARNKDHVTLYSLDNDLVVPDYDGDEGEGWQLCEWMLENAPKRSIILHTTNSHAAIKMEMMCQDADWTTQRVVPFNDMGWIHDEWVHVVERLLGS